MTIVQAVRLKPKRKGNRLPKTKKQIEAATKVILKIALLNNPMKNSLYRNKVSGKLKGRITSPNTLFQKGNKLGHLRKNTKLSERQKNLLRMQRLGTKGHPNQIEAARKMCLSDKNPGKTQKSRETVRRRNLLNNPMKNPEVAEKVRQKNLGRPTSEKQKEVARKMWLTNNPMKREEVKAKFRNPKNLRILEEGRNKMIERNLKKFEEIDKQIIYMLEEEKLKPSDISRILNCGKWIIHDAIKRDARRKNKKEVGIDYGKNDNSKNFIWNAPVIEEKTIVS